MSIPFVPIDCDDCPDEATRVERRLHVKLAHIDTRHPFASARLYAVKAHGWTLRHTTAREPQPWMTCPQCQPKPKEEKR